ncbi:MAG: hypothetical protein SGCHY_001140 [Lobulomycetales sp.]
MKLLRVVEGLLAEPGSSSKMHVGQVHMSPSPKMGTRKSKEEAAANSFTQSQATQTEAPEEEVASPIVVYPLGDPRRRPEVWETLPIPVY